MKILIENILAVLPGGPKVRSIYISDGKIESVDTRPADFVPDKTINGSGRLLIPGLINAHTHAYMTVFRNYADDLPFNDWLFDKIMPLEDSLTPDDCYWGTLLGIMEMLRSGTTAFADMYIHTNCAPRAVSDSGIRAVLSRGLSGGEGDPAGARRLRDALDEIEAWSGHDNITFMLAPHAPYTCDPGYQREIAREAARLGLRVNIHVSESLAEIETIRERYGCSPVELIDRNGLLTDKTLAAHCVQLDDRDISLFAERGASIVTNPISNLKLANGVAPVLKMLGAGINVALGTDSAASNNSLNLFRDLNYLTLLHKGINHDAEAVSARTGLEIATVNGARALGLSGTGKIEAGMAADLAVIDLDRPNMQPVNDPVAAIAYSAFGSEVETVIVGGRVLMEKCEFLTIDGEKVIDEVNKVCKRIYG
jgi:5-methylthioadenosine/S-adenosylhomocysteine deaminase